MSRPNIVLTGFMGTGKSSVGRRLAQSSGRQFVDTDQLISQQMGATIAEIFEEKGEPAFRALEAEQVKHLAKKTDLVIATGGGLVLDPVNVLRLAENGIFICLTANPTEVAARIADSPGLRPLIIGANPTDEINRLYSERAPIYDQFTQVDTTGKSIDLVSKEILSIVAAHRDRVGVMTPVLSRLTVTHPTGSYEILVGRGLLGSLTGLAAVKGRYALVTDGNVHPHASRVGTSAPDLVVTLPVGEQHKTISAVQDIWDAMLTAGLDRHSTLVTLGGGVVGDTAGFAAATYMRGIKLVHCPTTLLAMVDASFGGKTGVNLEQGKNLVGAFKQPQSVVADIDTLRTLPAGEFANGMAEVIKHALLSSQEMFDELLEQKSLAPTSASGNVLQRFIVQAIEVKRSFVESDPYESGLRKKLNLGHTFAHAIESVSKFQISHGQAVAIGLHAAALLSAKLGYCDPVWIDRIAHLLNKFDLPTSAGRELPAEALLHAMTHDKKKAHGKGNFVLFSEPGNVFVSDEVSHKALNEVLRAISA